MNLVKFPPGHGGNDDLMMDQLPQWTPRVAALKDPWVCYSRYLLTEFNNCPETWVLSNLYFYSFLTTCWNLFMVITYSVDAVERDYVEKCHTIPLILVKVSKPCVNNVSKPKIQHLTWQNLSIRPSHTFTVLIINKIYRVRFMFLTFRMKMQSGADSQKHTLTSVEEKTQDQLDHLSDKPTDAARFATRKLYQHKYL